MYGEVPEKIQDEIKGHYMAGRGSIQDYARIYHLSVPQVLKIVGEEDLGEVEIGGDLVDASEMGRAGAADIRPPHKEDVPFDVN